MRISKLKDDAIADASSTPQRFRSITRDPDRRDAALRPAHLNWMVFIGDLLSRIEIANDAHGVFQILDSRRFLTHHSARAVAAADTAVHAAAGNTVQRRKQTSSHSGIADYWIRH